MKLSRRHFQRLAAGAVATIATTVLPQVNPRLFAIPIGLLAAIYLAEKICGLRVFGDERGKMNLSVQQAGGSVLAVSQFTLYGDVRRGKRPSFDAAAPPEKARALYEFLVEQIRHAGLICETGRFQEMMTVELVNEGPVTILLDSGKGF